MRLKHPSGFDSATFDVFRASTEIFTAYAATLLRTWHRLPHHGNHPTVEYVFFAPELSSDRTIASLPIGGERTLGTRAAIEDGSSFLLWRFLPPEFMVHVEEGITETTDRTRGPQTTWHRPSPCIGFGNVRPLGGVEPPR